MQRKKEIIRDLYLGKRRKENLCMTATDEKQLPSRGQVIFLTCLGSTPEETVTSKRN
jgi:hypothetical protein